MQTNKQTEKPSALAGERALGEMGIAFTEVGGIAQALAAHIVEERETVSRADMEHFLSNGRQYDEDELWEQFLGPALDWLEQEALEASKSVFWHGTLDGLVGISLMMSLGDAESASHQGECHEDAGHVARLTYIAEQLDTIGPDAIRQALRETGGWEAEELGDDQENRTRAVWIAAGDIVEAHQEAARN